MDAVMEASVTPLVESHSCVPGQPQSISTLTARPAIMPAIKSSPCLLVHRVAAHHALAPPLVCMQLASAEHKSSAACAAVAAAAAGRAVPHAQLSQRRWTWSRVSTAGCLLPKKCRHCQTASCVAVVGVVAMIYMHELHHFVNS